MHGVSCAIEVMKESIPLLSIIIPVFNEAPILAVLHTRLVQAVSTITQNYEVVWVNDSSSDDSLSLLKEFSTTDPRHRYISLSRNFGHQKAITAGLDHCRGEAAVVMDGDLQDPPELIPELWKQYREGYPVVYAQRRSRKGESFFKKATAQAFYRILKKTARIDIPVDTGDFRLIDRKIIDYLKQMPEQHKFIRGQIAWIGFRQTCVRYDRDERYAGKSHYSLFRMMRFAIDGLTAFSNYPLRLATVTGFGVSLLSFLIILYALISKFVWHQVITGWTSLIVSSMFIGGVQLIAIGIIGEYISRISSDVRKRPLYVIEEDNVQQKEER
jgi:polyisoprenyl-phosphate glycosyltransferase